MAKSADDYCNAIDAYIRDEITEGQMNVILREGHRFWGQSTARWPAPQGNPCPNETKVTFGQSGRGAFGR